MPLVDEITLGRDLRNNEIANVYYFYGKDVAMIEAYTKRMVKKLVPEDMQAMNYQSFDGKKLDLSTLSDSCEVYPMFAQRVVVTVNDLNADSITTEDYKFLTRILQNLPDTTVVIFYATGVDLYKNKIKLTDKNQKLADFCAKNGVACDFALKSVNEMSKIIAQKVTKNGCSISKKSAEYLAEKCNGDTVFANSEVEKICSYVNGGDITDEIIDLLCVRKLESDAFQLASAIARRDSKKAYSMLDELFALQADAFQILSAVSMNFIDIYRASVGKSKGKNPSQITDDFKYPKNRAFAVKKAYNESSNFVPKRVRKCMAVLSQTDFAMKSQRTDKRLLLEEAVAQMLM